MDATLAEAIESEGEGESASDELKNRQASMQFIINFLFFFNYSPFTNLGAPINFLLHKLP